MAEVEAIPGSAGVIRSDGVTLSDRLATELGVRIIRGDWPAGSRIPTEADLSVSYDVSRSVIRDAIRTLASRGLVDVRQGSRMQVSQPSSAPFISALVIYLMRSGLTVGEVRKARAVLETQLAPLAAIRSRADDWRVMSEALEQYSISVREQAWAAAERAHLAFHQAIIHSIHLPGLDALLQPMQEIILLCSRPGSTESVPLEETFTLASVNSHRPILEAVRNRDESSVTRAMAEHFASSLGNLDETGDVFRGSRDAPISEVANAEPILRSLLQSGPVRYPDFAHGGDKT